MSGSTAGPRVEFLGVSTAGSSINKVFPRWAQMLSLPTQTLVGRDLALDAPDDAYREFVQRLAADDDAFGALVTTHKIRLFEAASDLFDDLDRFARACGEISSISKRSGALVGHAKDPLTVGLALADFLPPTHFADTGAHVLVLGAGGSGTALAWHLGMREDRPARVVVTDTSAPRLDHLERALERAGGSVQVTRLPVSSPAQTERALASLPEGSLVANATGLGKDRPGSPVTDDAVFPRHGYVWDFNYRGTLDFLRQAGARAESDALTVVDGWRYFIHGWSQIIAEIFQLELAPETVESLATVAGEVR